MNLFLLISMKIYDNKRGKVGSAISARYRERIAINKHPNNSVD